VRPPGRARAGGGRPPHPNHPPPPRPPPADPSLPPPPLIAVGGQGGAWAARSKASLLLALVIKRSGADLWEAALPQLVAIAAEGPVIQARRRGQRVVFGGGGTGHWGLQALCGAQGTLLSEGVSGQGPLV
jgi:hypothetical protein